MRIARLGLLQNKALVRVIGETMVSFDGGFMYLPSAEVISKIVDKMYLK